MPAMVVIFSCHILRFSMSLKYSASTEKSPQPGHHVGWSAAISFLVSPLRSSVPFPKLAGDGTLVILPPRAGISVTGELINMVIGYFAFKSLVSNLPQSRRDVDAGLLHD